MKKSRESAHDKLRRSDNVAQVIEFCVDKKFGYAIATALHEEYGHVIHVLVGLRSTPLKNIESLLGRRVSAIVYYPLMNALRRQWCQVRGGIALTESLPWQPLFRTQLNLPVGDEWSIWDGQTRRYVGLLTEEEKARHPVLQVVSDIFIERALRGAVPEPPSWDSF